MSDSASIEGYILSKRTAIHNRGNAFPLFQLTINSSLTTAADSLLNESSAFTDAVSFLPVGGFPQGPGGPYDDPVKLDIGTETAIQTGRKIPLFVQFVYYAR
jgi:hypothetical protein